MEQQPINALVETSGIDGFAADPTGQIGGGQTGGGQTGGRALWHPVDELAQVQAEMERLRLRRQALVDMFLSPGADSRFEGQTHVVEVVAENRRTFDRRRLPAAILQDDRFYAVSTCRNVRLVPKVPEPEDAAVIEPFH